MTAGSYVMYVIFHWTYKELKPFSAQIEHIFLVPFIEPIRNWNQEGDKRRRRELDFHWTYKELKPVGVWDVREGYVLSLNL